MPKKKHASPGNGSAGVDVALLKRDVSSLDARWIPILTHVIAGLASGRPEDQLTPALPDSPFADMPLLDTLELLAPPALLTLRHTATARRVATTPRLDRDARSASPADARAAAAARRRRRAGGAAAGGATRGARRVHSVVAPSASRGASSGSACRTARRPRSSRAPSRSRSSCSAAA